VIWVVFGVWLAAELPEHWYEGLAVDPPFEIFSEWEEPIGFGNDVWVNRAARAGILGLTPYTELPPPLDTVWLRLGDMAQDATNELYVARLVDGVTRWVGLQSRGVEGFDHLAFAAPILAASNTQEIVIPGVPSGKAIRDLAQLTMGIPIPRRCVQLIAGDGKNYDRFRVYQPYSWYDEHMYATGVALIEDATP